MKPALLFMMLMAALVVRPPVGAADEPVPCDAPPVQAVVRPGGIGAIQRIQGDDIVIDDRRYKLGPDTQYMTAGGEIAWKEAFQQGDTVIFEVDSGRDIRLLRRLK